MIPPINNLFEQLKSCIKFAAEVKDPITITVAIRIGALIIEENGIFPIINKEWRSKAAHQCTLVDFKTHFRQEDKEYLREAATSQAECHAANAVYQPKPIPIEQDMETLVLSSAPFTTTPSALAAAIAEASTVASQVTNPVSTLTLVNCTIVVLVAVAAASGWNNNNRNRNRNRNNDNMIPSGYGYCWSHGHVPQRGTEPHNSAT